MFDRLGIPIHRKAAKQPVGEVLPANIVDDWRSREPARMFEALLAIGVDDDDERLRIFAESVGEYHLEKTLPEWRQYIPTDINPRMWAENWCGAVHNRWDTSGTRSAYLSCLFGAEIAAEREECEECNGQGKYSDYSLDGSWAQNDIPCQTCNQLGSVRKDAPLLDHSLLSSDVLMVAQKINGNKRMTQFDDLPCFEIMPVLRGALEDAGCANEEILDHCQRCGDELHQHLPGKCWVIKAILGAQRDARMSSDLYGRSELEPEHG